MPRRPQRHACMLALPKKKEKKRERQGRAGNIKHRMDEPSPCAAGTDHMHCVPAEAGSGSQSGAALVLLRKHRGSDPEGPWYGG